ncbi:MAG: response regulator [Caldisericia bacterium]|nr:response regulator [Caldisericia bacterium]
MEGKILNVDDEEFNLEFLNAFLTSRGFEVIDAKDGREAVILATEKKPDLILMDIMMPIMDGIEATRILKRNKNTKDIPIIIVTAAAHRENKARAAEAGADEFISKPIDLVELEIRIKNLLKIREYNALKTGYQTHLEDEIFKKTEKLRKLLKEKELLSYETIEKLGVAGEYRDDETGKHVKRVGKFSEVIAEGIGLCKEFVDTIKLASPLHDIGKIGIPDRILLKPASLTPEEFKVMMRHTIIGKKILSGSINPVLKMAEKIAFSHHEKWNGTGYPRGLKGEEIPLEGRIVSVVDSFDAMTSKRVYKKSFSYDFAFNEIKKLSGSSYDPEVVKVFIEKFEEIKKIKEQYKDEN